jgi:cbb3-type cytochrome oxidase subunit 3
MRIIKGIAMGLLAVLAALVAFVIGVGWWVGRSARPGESIGWDPVSMFRQQPLISVAMCLIFVAGFAIGYRRHLRRTAH